MFKRKLLASLLAMSLIAVPLVVGAATSPEEASRQAPKSPQVSNSVLYRIRNKETNRYLTVNGTGLSTMDKNGSDSQLFRVDYDSTKNAYQLLSSSKPQLAVTASTFEAGAAATMKTNSGANNQWWLLRGYGVRAMLANYADWDFNLVPGSEVTLGRFSEAPQLKTWDFEQVSPETKLTSGRYRIYNQKMKSYLHVNTDYVTDEETLDLDANYRKGETYQEFNLQRNEDGLYSISSANNAGKYIQNFTPDAAVKLAYTPCYFQIVEVDGAYRIISNDWNTVALCAETDTPAVTGSFCAEDGQDWVFLKV